MKRIPLLLAFLLFAANVHAVSLGAQATSRGVLLTWSAPVPTAAMPSIATAYGVMRGPCGAETPLFTVGNVTTYTDTSVVAGQTYCYFVFAISGAIVSVPSNEISVTIPAQGNSPPPGYVLCAVEGQNCSITGAVDAIFGSGVTFVHKTAVAAFPCTNGFFGSDPTPNVVKSCYTKLLTPPAPAPTPLTSGTITCTTVISYTVDSLGNKTFGAPTVSCVER